MGSSDPELIVDQVGNLSTSKETVLFLSLLFLQTDSPIELGILDELIQCRSDPRIKYFKISALKYHEQMTKILIHPLNQPAPLP